MLMPWCVHVWWSQDRKYSLTRLEWVLSCYHMRTRLMESSNQHQHAWSLDGWSQRCKQGAGIHADEGLSGKEEGRDTGEGRDSVDDAFAIAPGHADTICRQHHPSALYRLAWVSQAGRQLMRLSSSPFARQCAGVKMLWLWEHVGAIEWGRCSERAPGACSCSSTLKRACLTHMMGITRLHKETCHRKSTYNMRFASLMQWTARGALSISKRDEACVAAWATWGRSTCDSQVAQSVAKKLVVPTPEPDADWQR